MKLTRTGQAFLAIAASLGLGLSITSCSPSNTIDYVYVTSNTPQGEISAYHADSVSGALSQVAGSPFASQGSNPVAEIASPNGQYLYVANHGSNNIAVFTVGTDGQLASTHTYTTPGSEPMSLAMNTAGTLLFVVDYYAPGYSDSAPGPGALVVYPVNSDGSLGNPVSNGGAAFTGLQCFPFGVAVSPNGDFVYVTNTNSVIATTSAPTTGTTPTGTAAGCPANGTISGFAIGSSGSLTPVTGSPFSAGSTPTGIAIDPTNRFVYATDSVQNQIIAYDILSTGVLSPLTNGPFATGTFPVSVVVDPRGLYLYVTNYNAGSISEYSIAQSTGTPDAGAAATYATDAPSPTCIVVEPALGRYVYTSDYTGSNISAGELNPNTGALSGVQNAPFPANGTPTCVTAIPHGNHASQYVSATAGQ